MARIPSVGVYAMRKAVLFLPVLLLASPAFAQDRDPPPAAATGSGDLHTAARALSNPRVQAGVVGIVTALTDIVMDTRIGPMADLSPEVRRDDTLGSLTERRDPGFRARTQAGTAGALAGRAATGAAAMSDNLAVTVERLRAVVEGVRGAAR